MQPIKKAFLNRADMCSERFIPFIIYIKNCNFSYENPRKEEANESEAYIMLDDEISNLFNYIGDNYQFDMLCDSRGLFAPKGILLIVLRIPVKD